LTEQILRCCKNNASFLITYKVGSKFLVCESCLEIDYWSRGIKEKIPTKELGEKIDNCSPSSTPLLEVIDIG